MRNLVFAGLAALALAGCATEPVYQAQQSPGGIGYSDTQLAANRYRVTYNGSGTTHRDLVEDFLLRRAAEVTLKAGYHWFEFDTRDTKAKTTYFDEFAGWPGWHGYGRYWHSWGPPGPYDVQAVTRYQAYAEIVLLTDDQAKAEPRALEANDVLSHLNPAPKP
jgi:hypothetical protein